MSDKGITEQILMARRYAEDAKDEADLYRPDAPLDAQHHFPPRGYWPSEAMYDLMYDLSRAWIDMASRMEDISNRLDRAMDAESQRKVDQ